MRTSRQDVRFLPIFAPCILRREVCVAGEAVRLGDVMDVMARSHGFCDGCRPRATGKNDREFGKVLSVSFHLFRAARAVFFRHSRWRSKVVVRANF